MPRCAWATSEPAITYHDKEWGVPVHDDRVLFEFLILEGAQAGLSWNTILKKRENYRKALDGFRAEKIALYSKRDVQRLLRNDGIVRNRLKIAATIENAKRFLEVRKRIRNFRRLSLEFCWKQANSESLAHPWRNTRTHRRIRRHEPRPVATRIQVRRLNDLLRLHASDRHGQRSPRNMSATRGTRWPTSAQIKASHPLKLNV